MKIIVAITGASGSLYAQLLLDRLEKHSQIEEIAVVVSDTGKTVWQHELNIPLPTNSHKITLYANNNFFSPMASGSCRYDAMIILPASAGTIGRIAAGISSDLIGRAADVMLKERRKLIIAPRETPFSAIHLNNMSLLTSSGAIILPLTPSFYFHPQTIEALCQTVIDRILSLVGLEDGQRSWGGER